MPDRQPIALIVDDEPDICDLISMTLHRMGVRADIAMSVTEAKRRLNEKHYDFCLTDMRLPDGEGLEIVAEIQDFPAERLLPVAVITAHGNMDTAITALKLGAFDFVSKPVNLERLRSLVQLALRLNEGRVVEQQEFPPLLQGPSESIQKLRSQIEKIARSDAPAHIVGETGTGKELAARSIHEQSPRSDKPFIPVYCAAVPANNIEETLFGRRDSDSLSSGIVFAANGGTLFLDEVSCLPPETQIKLLQTIQDKKLPGANGNAGLDLNLRILSASQTPLIEEVRTGRFHSDLYYCINVIELHAPPVRQRKDDIPLLVRNTLRKISVDRRGGVPKASQDAINALQAYTFPGNLLELENILERAVTLCERNTLYATDLLIPAEQPAAGASLYSEPTKSQHTTSQPLGLKPLMESELRSYPGQFSASDYSTLDEFLQTIERTAIEDALSETDWNRTAAAERLGISFRSLRYRLKKLGLENE
ncbi:sigma-54 dependent transcriptional regulator [uncultured Microbulbifer sp.]|uniref:sigma-54-dependent transcriptional regulator n=1 Tax=uncultured Microbulbifer sp. TaxID=348147 RepID=UPI00263896FC|nr:sigma-54 dependent transcriptional regulator [uncultured Microbulbifer sp.]